MNFLVLLQVGCCLQVAAVRRTFAPAPNPIRPTFYMHGLDEVSSSGDAVGQQIQALFPGTLFIPINLYEGPESFTNMHIQLGGVISFIQGKIKASPTDFADGINLICHSQGGLLCRGICSFWADHPVKTFISTSGPQQGIDSYAMYAKLVPTLLQPFLSLFSLYSAQLQSGKGLPKGLTGFSGANYYKDMKDYGAYQRASEYLAIMNNEAPQDRCKYALFRGCIPATKAVSGLKCKLDGAYGCAWFGDDQYNRNADVQTNFARVEKAVFLGSPDDGIIVPWQSAVWGYYASNNGVKDHSPTVVPYAETVLGQKNTVPLQAMMDAGKVVLKNISGVAHGDWLKAETVKYYSEYLK